MNKMIRRASVLLVAILASIHVSATQSQGPATWTYDPQHPTASCPSMPSCGVWLQFRTSHPWPYQTFAVKESSEEAIVIISEPSPVFSREQLAQTLGAIFGDELLDLRYYRWPTGLDGWLEDVVLRVRVRNQEKLPVLSGTSFTKWDMPAAIAARLQLLHLLCFRTRDGFWVDQVAQEPAAARSLPELKIPVTDLAAWLADPAGLWTSLAEGGGKKTTKELFAQTTPGVFYQEGGVVAFVAPRDVRLIDLAPDFRRFAVATDLIIGATKLKKGGLILLGRSRQLPFATLPPLRFETLARFARAPSEHLAQSYERQRVFAGRIRTGKYQGWDWAPILLSPQLEDSDFGTLLDFADQILKSWSQHGRVEYYAFPYPQPDTFPFGALAASEYFADKFGTAALLLNWNTEGLATVTTVNGMDVLTGDRSGALSILYRPSDRILDEFDDDAASLLDVRKDADARAREARDYFATRGDPVLVRVVQHVMLFQAAQRFLSVNDRKLAPASSRSDQVTSVLEKHATAWLANLQRGTTQEDRDLGLLIGNFVKTSGFTNEKLAHMLASPQSMEQDWEQALQRYRTSRSEAVWMAEHFLETYQNAGAALVAACKLIGGRMIVDKVKGEGCSYQKRVGDSDDSAFAEFEGIQQTLEKMASEFKNNEAKLREQESLLVSLSESYDKASKLTEKLSRRSAAVDLDQILQSVIESTSAVAQQGSIRTPSVVLSKNNEDQRSIGGHNIDLVPRRRFIVPPVREAAPKPGSPKPAPPLSEAVALDVRRSGSLLEEMRPAAARVEVQADRWAGIQDRAKVCKCDALIVQGEDGVIYFVRNAPPPGKQAIFGKSGIVDALASPPPIKNARFENFGDATVKNIARSTALITSEPSSNLFDQALKEISALLKPTESRDPGTIFTIERVGKTQELLTLSGTKPALNETMSRRSSSVVEATPERWSEVFGNDEVLETDTSDALMVRFGGNSGAAPSWLGVSVRVEATQRAGIRARLRAVIDRWRGSLAVKPGRWDESIIELRQTIRQELKPLDWEFYYKHNKGKIRAADASSPKSDCTDVLCKT